MNSEALNVLQQQRTDEDALRILRGYSGQGGVGASTDEYFTPVPLARALSGRALALTPDVDFPVLEPSCGAGTFLEFLPAGTVGVELSSVSAQIAAVLHPDKTIRHQAFEQFATAQTGPAFRLVIGNPPYGTRRAPGLDLPNIREASRYFLHRILDLTVDGGVIALIVPNGIARHEQGRDLRLAILQRAKILGVLGLPTDAFASAHARLATTDVLLLQRRKRYHQALTMVSDDAMQAVLSDPLNAAFADGEIHAFRPDWMAGDEEQRRGPAGRPVFCRTGTLDDAVRLTENAQWHDEPDVTAALTRLGASEGLSAHIRDRAYALSARLYQPAPQPGTTRMNGDQLQVFYRRWHPVTPEQNIIAQSLEQAGRAVRAHAEALAFDHDERARSLAGRLTPVLERLHADTLTHARKLATLARHDANILAGLTAAQVSPPLLPEAQPGRPDLLRDAFERLRGQYTEVTEGALADEFSLSDADAAERLSTAGFLRGPREWLTPQEYFTGEADSRLRQIDMMRVHPHTPAYLLPILDRQEQQVRAAAQRVPLKDIPINPGAGLITAEMLQGWVDSTYDLDVPLAPIRVTVLKQFNEVEVIGEAEPKFKTTFNYIRRYLTGRGRMKHEYAEYAASDESLRAYVLAHHAAELEAQYNRQVTHLKPVFDTSPVLDLCPWYDGPTPHPHQNEAVRRGLIERSTLDSQDVGLGKTITGLLRAATEHEQTGRTAVIAVPRNVHDKWRRAAELCLPGLRCVTPEFEGGVSYSDKDNLSRRIRQAIGSRAPIVLMTHDTLARMPVPGALQLEILTQEFRVQAGERPSGMSESLYARYAQAQVDAWLQDGSVTETDLSAGADAAREALEQAEITLVDTDTSLDRKQRAEEARRLRFVSSKQRSASNETIHPLDVLWTEIDACVLIIDEAHRMRRLMTVAGRNSIKYLSAPTDSSLRAMDAFLKIRHLQREGRGVHLLTATVVQNSLTDMYNMISLANPAVFPAHGIFTIDAFIEQYAETEFQTYADENGDEHSEEVMVGIRNLPELQSIMRQVIHRRTAEGVGMHVPKIKREFRMLNVDDEQERVIQEIVDDPLAAVARYLKPDLVLPEPGTSDWTALLERYRITVGSLLRRAELDLGMLDPVTYPAHVSPKVQGLLGAAAGHLSTHRKCVIFCDSLHFPKGHGLPDRHFHAKLARLLSEKTGIPLSEIGLINGTDTPDTDERGEICEQFNAGTLRVVIGTRSAMGEGVDLQTDCVQGYGLDVPWTPGVMHQTEGRVARYPNPADTVFFDYFLSDRALDPHMLDVLSGKLNWYEMLWAADGESIRTDFGSRAPTVEEILTLRLKTRGERDAALREIREREADATARSAAARELRTVERYQLALHALHAFDEREGAVTSETGLAARRRLEVALRVSEEALTQLKNVPVHTMTGENASAFVHKGDVYRAGDAARVMSPASSKYSSPTQGLYTVTGVDIPRRALHLTRLPDVSGAAYTETLTVTPRSHVKVFPAPLEDILAAHAQPDHSALPEVYRPALDRWLGTSLRARGQAHFVVRGKELKWDIPRRSDTVVTAWRYPAWAAQIEAFTNSDEGRLAAAQVAPDVSAGLWWSVPGTPHAARLHYLQH